MTIMTRYDKRAKREELAQQIDMLSQQYCEGCPLKEQLDTACLKCEHIVHFKAIGDELDKIAIGYQTERRPGGVLKHDLSALTKDIYIQLKREFYTDSKIADLYKVNKMAINNWKRKNNVSQKDWQ